MLTYIQKISFSRRVVGENLTKAEVLTDLAQRVGSIQIEGFGISEIDAWRVRQPDTEGEEARIWNEE